MGDIFVPGDDIFWIADQAAYGTEIADDAASGWAELQCRGGLITPDILKRDVKADRGRRYKDTADHAVSETGAAPLITMPDMIVRKDDLSRFLYSYLGQMSEDAGTPYEKTAIYPSTGHPDYGSDEALFHSIIHKLPIASSSYKVIDCVCSRLAFNCSPKGALMMSADFIGRGTVLSNANPTSTPSAAGDDFFYWEKLRVFTYNVGGGAQNVTPFNLSLELTKKVITVGFDSATGKYENITFDEYGGTFKMTVLYDSNVKELITDHQDGTPIEINFGWGHATPGTDDGDLDFVLYGLIDGSSISRGDTLNKEITVDLMAKAASTKVPITVIMADDVDQGY